MHGPYTAKIEIRGQEPIVLSGDELAEGDRIADRFYSSGGGTGLFVGATRAAVFTAALLLSPGEEATVEIAGREGTEGSSRPCQASAWNGDHRYCSRCDGTGRETARDVVAKTERVRRDDAGRVFSTLGSRFSEREFKSSALATATA